MVIINIIIFLHSYLREGYLKKIFQKKAGSAHPLITHGQCSMVHET